MPRFEDARRLLVAIRDRLDDWVYEARAGAYDELFEGTEPILTAEEVRTLDRIDSRLHRVQGEGLWGEDAYGIVPAGAIEEESSPHVAATYYPQIPEYVNREEALVDEEIRTRLNDALWEYTERVVELVQERLAAFVWSSEVETWVE